MEQDAVGLVEPFMDRGVWGLVFFLLMALFWMFRSLLAVVRENTKAFVRLSETIDHQHAASKETSEAVYHMRNAANNLETAMKQRPCFALSPEQVRILTREAEGAGGRPTPCGGGGGRVPCAVC